ncbi:MAG: hypothetical protein ACFFC7_20755 [Candidatus Hermodarchaeota archaeon]
MPICKKCGTYYVRAPCPGCTGAITEPKMVPETTKTTTDDVKEQTVRIESTQNEANEIVSEDKEQLITNKGKLIPPEIKKRVFRHSVSAKKGFLGPGLTIVRLFKQIEQKDQIIAQLEAKVAEQDKLIEKLQNEFEELNNETAEIEEKLQKTSKKKSELDTSIYMLEKEKDKNIKELEASLEEQQKVEAATNQKKEEETRKKRNLEEVEELSSPSTSMEEPIVSSPVTKTSTAQETEELPTTKVEAAEIVTSDMLSASTSPAISYVEVLDTVGELKSFESSECASCGYDSPLNDQTISKGSHLCPLCTLDGTIEPNFQTTVYRIAVNSLEGNFKLQDSMNALQRAYKLVSQQPYWKNKHYLPPHGEDARRITTRLSEINRKEAIILLLLENQIGKTIPRVSRVAWNTLGFTVEDNHIIELGLYKQRLESIPTIIGKLSNLKGLFLSFNRIRSLPKTIGDLSRLEHLDLSWNRLTSLPLTIGKLSRLDTLRLYNNRLEILPFTIGSLSNLKFLELQHNKLPSLPETIFQLLEMQSLTLGGNKLTSLSDSFGILQNLHTLDLNRNQLSTLPETIGNLKYLRTLVLEENNLISLPASIGNLRNLQILTLRDNMLSAIPESLFKLSGLQCLNLGGNAAGSLPETIGKLTNLKELYLAFSQVDSLPETIGNLKNLKEVQLYSNELTSLPKSFKQLQNLETLDLRWNKISSIPTCLNTLSKLRYLDLRYNDMLGDKADRYASREDVRELLDKREIK